MSSVVSRPWPGSTSRSPGEREQPPVDRLDDLVEVPAREARVPGAAGEQGVAAEQHRVPFEQEARRSGGVPGRVDGAQPQVAHLDHVVVGDREVVRREHRRVLGGDPHVDAGVAHGLDGLDVVPVPVGRQDAPDARGPAHVEEQVVLVGGVEQGRVAGALAPENEHVVLERPDRELVDPELGGLVVGRPVHTLQGTGALAT